MEGYQGSDAKRRAIQLGQVYPVCLKGKRACPPEDCGGAWGYLDLLEAISDPEYEEHEEMLKWHGEFDPEAFDLAAINLALRARF